MLSRRAAIKGATATAGLLLCEPVAAIIFPAMPCGCRRVHEVAFGDECIVHDETGRKWSSYTPDDYAKRERIPIEAQTADSEWSCYCGKHPDNLMPVGTKCVWHKTSYYDDEWECRCLQSERDEWLYAVTTDWRSLSKEILA